MGVVTMVRRFVIGDIHGQAKAFRALLKRVNFDYEKDVLISLGDVIDRGKDSFEAVEEMLKVKNLVFCKGNHDQWMIDYLNTGKPDPVWLVNGGDKTLASYKDYGGIPQSHKDFFLNAKPFHKEDGMVFVHAGFDTNTTITVQPEDVILWLREFVREWMDKGIKTHYKRVFVGHTPTWEWDVATPYSKSSNGTKIWAMDTGAGYPEYDGHLTIMDIDTEEFFQERV
jgi:serine/threonine protein phosphatase 1